MKIAVVNNLYPPFNRGGSSRVVQKQISDFKRAGHHVFVITTRPLFASPSIEEQLCKVYFIYPWNIFSVYYINKFNFLLRSVWRLIDIFNLSTYFKIKHIFNKEKPDIVYAHNLTGLGYLLPRLFKKMGIRYVQIIHDVALIRPSGLLIYGYEYDNFFIKLYINLTKHLFASPHEIIFPSQWIKQYYEKYNFFPLSHKRIVKNFNLDIKNLLDYKKLKTKQQINFLYLGQMEKHKGILLLIDVFNHLPNRLREKYNLLIVGQGSQLANCKKKAKQNKHIIFYGHQPANKVKIFLNLADYLIVPSLCYENAPTVIFEALDGQLPVIASNLGGINELIIDNKNGYLFEAGNKRLLIKILEKIFKLHNL